ncbi:MAG: precorrin-2 C(20)-methyltransferase [Rhodospirillaceae bacterium]|nr:precorrin-2 C(20)-methyltransferase [Rhodospirillaceae bacterium]|tara:strand:+ start:225 stop:929 length:705 start_codon:yes stop_codon:yes gene_type:complete
MSGTLYGVGVGPGDPELLTLKALRCIEAADVIAYPQLEDTTSFARSVVSDYIGETQSEMPIPIPMLRDPEPAQKAYDKAAEDIDGKLKKGQIVTVLCEGDPFFYGSFQFLFSRLADRHRVEVVPGVSSLMSCAAALSAPLSAKNDVLTVLPAPLSDDELRTRLDATDAAAIIKIGRHFGRIFALLQSMQLETSSRYIERSTLPTERVLPLDRIDAEKVPYFSMILVHKRGDAWR